MTCASCGEKKCNCKQDSCSAPAVLEIVNKPEIVTFHKVIIPASVGDETTKPPVPGLYRNTLLVYEASNEAYLYSSDCIPTKITDKAELKRLETLLGNEVAERKEADAYLEEKIDNIKGLKYEIVETLPETGEAGIIYLVPKTSEAPDFYDEYIWVNDAFEKIGSTEVKLDDYVLKDEVFNRYNHPSGVKMTDGIKMTPYPDSPASASNGGIAIGVYSSATSAGGIALGAWTSSTEGGIDAIGSSSRSTAGGRAYAGGNASNGAIAFGGTATNAGVSVGPGADASMSGIAIGTSTSSSNKAIASGGGNSIAIGSNTSSTSGGYEAIGFNSVATQGGRAYAGGNATNGALAIGPSSVATAGLAIGCSYAISTNSKGHSVGSLAVGAGANSTNGGYEAVGMSSDAQAGGRAYAGGSATSSSALAFGGKANQSYALAIGQDDCIASAPSSIAIGRTAKAQAQGSVAIGFGSSVNASASGSAAIGSGSIATASNTVSFGSSSSKAYKRLVNVAPATADNDAVILSQLNSVESTLNAKIDGISMAKAPNVTIIGEPTINHGQVSDYSAFDYLQFPFILDLTGRTFVIDFCFTTGEDVTTQQNVIDSKYGIALAIQNGHGLMAVSSNGQSWDIGTATGTFTIAANTTYFARFSWDGATYKTALSTNGSTYTDDMTIVSATAPFPTTHYIGGANDTIVGHTVHPFEGIIDLNKCEMYINGELFWEGMDSLGLRTRADVSLSNIDAAGEEKIREVMTPIIGNIEAILAELNSGEGV